MQHLDTTWTLALPAFGLAQLAEGRS